MGCPGKHAFFQGCLGKRQNPPVRKRISNHTLNSPLDIRFPLTYYLGMVENEEESIEKTLTALKSRLTALLEGRLSKLALYGSRARGDYDEESDIDIAVIVKDLDRDLKMRILEEVADLELEHLTPLSTLILSEETYMKLLTRERRVALDIEKEGIAL